MMVSSSRYKQQEMRDIANIILTVRWYLLTVIANAPISKGHPKAISYLNKVSKVLEITTYTALFKAIDTMKNFRQIRSRNKSPPS